MTDDEVFWALVADADFEHHVVSAVKRGHVMWQVRCSCGETFSDRRETVLNRQAVHAAEIFTTT